MQLLLYLALEFRTTSLWWYSKNKKIIKHIFVSWTLVTFLYALFSNALVIKVQGLDYRNYT